MFFFFNDTATTEIYTLSLHDALPIYLEVVHARALHPTELEHVLETLGREHGGHRALLLENGVGRDRRAVNEPLDVAGRAAGEGQNVRDRGGDAVEQVFRRTRHFRQREPPTTVERHDVGEGAADVDADLHQSLPRNTIAPIEPSDFDRVSFVSIDSAIADGLSASSPYTERKSAATLRRSVSHCPSRSVVDRTTMNVTVPVF